MLRTGLVGWGQVLSFSDGRSERLQDLKPDPVPALRISPEASRTHA